MTCVRVMVVHVSVLAIGLMTFIASSMLLDFRPKKLISDIQ